VFRLRYKQLGGHIHCRLFESSAPATRSTTWQKNGELVFDARSWPVFCTLMETAGIDVREEDAPA
jgi:hypothetical protein